MYSYQIIAIVIAAMLLLVQISEPSDAFSAEASTDAVLEISKGKASYYGRNHHGKKTASGERFDQNALTAAHPRWPFDTMVRVVNLANGKDATVRIVDRGPAKKAQRRGVIIDVSTRAAKALGFIKQGKTAVRLEVLRWGE